MHSLEATCFFFWALSRGTQLQEGIELCNRKHTRTECQLARQLGEVMASPDTYVWTRSPLNSVVIKCVPKQCTRCSFSTPSSACGNEAKCDSHCQLCMSTNNKICNAKMRKLNSIDMICWLSNGTSGYVFWSSIDNYDLHLKSYILPCIVLWD